MNRITESQKLALSWRIVLTLIVGIPAFYRVYRHLINGYGSSTSKVILGLCICLLVIVITWSAGLTTEFDEKGISYRFFPFHLKKYFIPWEQIKTACIRIYNPLITFGGFGIRYNFKSKIKGYVLTGDNGIQIEKLDGKKIFLVPAKLQRYKFC
jgi:hypothetical protein